MPYKTCFALSVLFLWAYINLAKRFENKIDKNISSKPKNIWGWVLVGVGVLFSALQFIALPFVFERQSPSGTVFLWFCFFGIFSVVTLRTVHGLFKCLKELKIRDDQK